MIKKLAALFFLPSALFASSPVRYVQISTNTLSQQSGSANFQGATISTITPLGIVGTTTNNNAAAGNYGERMVTTTSTGTVFGSSGTWVSQITLTLTAGDWDVTGVGFFTTPSGTTRISYGISTTTGNNTTGFVQGDSQLDAPIQTGANSSGVIPNLRYSIAVSTTVFFKTYADFSGVTPTCGLRLSARRMR